MASGAGYRHSKVLIDSSMQEAKSGYDEDFLRKMKYATMGSTIQLVNNCEAKEDWDASGSYFTIADETSDKRCDGSNSIELVNASVIKGGTIALDATHRPNREDWRWANWLCLWVHDETTLRSSDQLLFQIRNNGNWSPEINVPIPTVVDAFQLRCVDITGLQRGCVDGFRFVDRRGKGSSLKVYIDEIFITDLITGTGDGNAIGTGPVFGKVIPMPVVTGSTIVPGDAVEWGVMGVATGTTADHRIVGIACQAEPIDPVAATDANPKEILVAIPFSVVYLRNDGTGMAQGAQGKLGSDVVSASVGSDTSDAEDGFCISLETSTTAAWKIGDSAYQLIVQGTEN